ncbi:uncharacterized protein TNCV_4404731 [Trichonephila clavipes]|uniref:Uncharacterized protein n=1 Tax=Trichonephila clavipes TaxID=2585209 RepID=A0A8X6S4X3_TRICX|nr:uncharacterized protein TNCV_4404731 [Trichonephila clavipes]
MAMSNIKRVSITPPQQRSKNTIDQNMIEGDSLYVKLRLLNAENPAGIQIEEDGYLEIRHFDLVKAGLEIFDHTFALEYENDSSLFGSLGDLVNHNSIGLPLKDVLCRLFVTHQTGIFIAARK